MLTLVDMVVVMCKLCVSELLTSPSGNYDGLVKRLANLLVLAYCRTGRRKAISISNRIVDEQCALERCWCGGVMRWADIWVG